MRDIEIKGRAVDGGVAPILYSGRARSRIAFLQELVSKGKSLAGADLRNADLSFIELNCVDFSDRSEEHTSELQSLMRISYAVFCLKKKKYKITTHKSDISTTNTY